ncbi:MAG: glucose-1-phosphate adenylyltransferase, partial [Alteromonadaceae bacterium]|jgi:glucose-1-phosphate adenylyltransferase
VMSVDENFRINGFAEKPEHPAPLPGDDTRCLASMGNYVFDTEFLFEQLRRDAETSGSQRDFGKDIIPSIIKDHPVYAFEFESTGGGDAYWRDVGTIDSFWEANMEMVAPVPQLNLYDQKWPIWTYQEQLPPAKFVWEDHDRRGEAINSVVSGGCIISGSTLRGTICFSNVRVHSYGLIEDAVILPDVEIMRHCKLRKVLLDRGCVIPEGTVIGYNHDDDRARGFRVSEKGVVLVTREMLGQPVGGLSPN